MTADAGSLCRLRSARVGRVLLFVALGVCAVTGCSKKSPPEPPDPLDTVNALLDLHGLKGVQPDQRSEKARDAVIDPKALAPLFTDYGRRDHFLDDLYVGFVVGALARFQGNLAVTATDERAEVSAGKARVVLKLKRGRYRIDLEASVPNEIKRRAKRQKALIDRARAKIPSPGS